MKKIFFSQFFDRNLTFFRWFWRSLEYLYCLLGVYYCPKYLYGSLSQSLLDVKRVRIGIKKIKNFCWKKIFHQNFWLKFDISHGVHVRKDDRMPTSSVKKKFWGIFSKICFHSFVGLDLENRLSTHNMGISLELKAKKDIDCKKAKTHSWVPFWNNRLQLLTKINIMKKSGFWSSFWKYLTSGWYFQFLRIFLQIILY